MFLAAHAMLQAEVLPHFLARDYRFGSIVQAIQRYLKVDVALKKRFEGLLNNVRA